MLGIIALARFALEDEGSAGSLLAQALTLGQAKGFRRLFLDEGQPLTALLRAVYPKLERPLAAYAATLLPASVPGQGAVPSALPESLSPQEQRVLRLLVAGLSNPEIARELVVSPNTVKTQVKSIYRKLNVSTRDEAREAARELNLL